MTRRPWVLLLAAVLLTGCAARQKAAPVDVTVSSGVTLPADCTADRVVAVISGFLDSVNRGKVQDALKYFGAGFQWYSAPAGGTGAHQVDSMFSVQELPQYFAKRIGQREQMQLQKLHLTGAGYRGWMNFGLGLHRTAQDLEWGSGDVVGKGALDCATGEITVWSLG